MERAFAGAAPAFEVIAPESGHVRGGLLALHGGAWVMVGAETLPSMRNVAARWAADGWVVLNADYRPGAGAVADATTAWRALRDALHGSDLPRAAYGKSSGGHVALMVASTQHDVAAVVAESAPTALHRLAETEGAAFVHRSAVESFGASRAALDAMSPASAEVAARLDAPILLGVSAGDDVVPPAQTEALRAARPDLVTALQLETGDTDFIHAGVSANAWDSFVAAERALRSSLV